MCLVLLKIDKKIIYLRFQSNNLTFRYIFRLGGEMVIVRYSSDLDLQVIYMLISKTFYVIADLEKVVTFLYKKKSSCR